MRGGDLVQKKLSPWCKKAKIAMIQNDISVNDLAEELGCSRCYLSSTLNGTFWSAVYIAAHRALQKQGSGARFTPWLVVCRC